MSAVADTSADRSFVSVAPRLGFVGGFDGLRGIGVVIVLFGHIFPDGTDSFNPIVDVFFVISAFLIVSLLMQEHRENGRIDLRRFYTRRAIRLLPNSYACMAAWMLIWAAIKAAGLTGKADAMEQVNAIPGNVLAAATYVYHLVYPIGGKPGPLVQFWTLSLEEQFYLVVGVAIVWLLARRKRVAWACGVMVALVAWIGWSRWNVDLGPWPGKEYSLDLWTRGLRLFWMARPDALLLGMLLDQQVPMEWAFLGPYTLRERLGGRLDAKAIVAMDRDEFVTLCCDKPAIHRFPGSMGKRIWDVCEFLVEHYDGNAAKIWNRVPSGEELYRRLREVPGYGDEKARIFIAILGKRLAIRPKGWKEAAAPFSDKEPRSVADVADEASLQRVREWKKMMKAQKKAKADQP